MTVKFIVDELDPDGKFGRTKSILKIKQNIERFNPSFSDFVVESLRNKAGINLFTHVGRFIVYLQLNREMTHGDLIFLDSENNIDKALDTINYLFDFDQRLREMFMIEFNKLKPNYRADYSLAELSLGDSVFN